MITADVVAMATLAICLQVRKDLPNLKAIVQYKGKLSESYPDVYDVSYTSGSGCVWTIHHQHDSLLFQWEQFLALGDSLDNDIVENKIYSQKPEDCAGLIYTVRSSHRMHNFFS